MAVALEGRGVDVVGTPVDLDRQPQMREGRVDDGDAPVEQGDGQVPLPALKPGAREHLATEPLRRGPRPGQGAGEQRPQGDHPVLPVEGPDLCGQLVQRQPPPDQRGVEHGLAQDPGGEPQAVRDRPGAGGGAQPAAHERVRLPEPRAHEHDMGQVQVAVRRDGHAGRASRALRPGQAVESGGTPPGQHATGPGREVGRHVVARASARARQDEDARVPLHEQAPLHRAGELPARPAGLLGLPAGERPVLGPRHGGEGRQGSHARMLPSGSRRRLGPSPAGPTPTTCGRSVQVSAISDRKPRSQAGEATQTGGTPCRFSGRVRSLPEAAANRAISSPRSSSGSMTASMTRSAASRRMSMSASYSSRSAAT